MSRWPQQTTAERFAAKVARGGADECWLWQGALNNFGYGKFGLSLGELGEPKKSSIVAHRVAWRLENGPIPTGLCVCHRCDNPRCVNPAHLFLGTKAENTRDMLAKGRDRQPLRRGIEVHNALLTDDRVREIRRMLAARTGTHRQIGALFGVRKSAISGIASGTSWSHVT